MLLKNSAHLKSLDRSIMVVAAVHDTLLSMQARALIFCLGLVVPCMAQQPRTPDLDKQRLAMKKLGFLIGKWSGQAHVQRGPGELVTLAQTEEAQYKLDGLVLTIEGTGRTVTDNKPVLQALGIVSYDDGTETYRMRAFNDGRFLESEVKLLDNGKGLTWGFGFGEIRSSSVLKINERGEWTELAEIIIGSQPPKKLMDLTVRRE